MATYNQKWKNQVHFEENMLNKEQNFTREMQEDTQAWNEEMFNQQNAWNYNMWTVQNAYNDPQQQMQRAMNAGINPNTVAAGIGGNGTAGSTPVASGPSMSSPGSPTPPTAPNPTDSTPELLNAVMGLVDTVTSSYKDVAMLPAMIDDLTAGAGQKRADAALKGSQRQGQDTKNWNDAMYEGQERQQGIENTKADTKDKLASAEFKESQKKMTEELTKGYHWDNEMKEQAYKFNDEMNQLLIDGQKEEINRLRAATNAFNTQSAANIAAANAANAQARKNTAEAVSIESENKLMYEDTDEDGQTRAEKLRDKDIEAKDIANKTEQENQIRLAWENECRKHGADPNSPAAQRALRLMIDDWHKQGGVKDAAAYVLGAIDWTLDKAGFVVGIAVSSALSKGKGTVKGSSPSVSNPILKGNASRGTGNPVGLGTPTVSPDGSTLYLYE